MSEASIMSEAMFVRLADELAAAGRFTEADCPIRLGGGGRYPPFPCIHTDGENLERLNADRDQEMNTRRDAVTIHPIQNGRYYVAVPRRADYRSRRADQLRKACVHIQRGA